MEQYKLVNLNDPNVGEVLESNTEFEAALEALEKLGWGLSKRDVPIYDDDDDSDEDEDSFLEDNLGHYEIFE